MGLKAGLRGSESSDRFSRRIGPFHLLPLVVALLLIAVTAGLTVFASVVVNNQEDRLLTERANEVNLVLSSSVNTVSANLQSLDEAYGIGGPAGFARAAAAQIASSAAPRGLALLRQDGSRFVVISSAGRGLTPGQTFVGTAADAMRAAQATSKMAGTGVYLSGRTRSVGFALGGPDGWVVFQQSLLGPVRPPAQAATQPFSEVRVVLYASARPEPSQVVVATRGALPMRGTVKYQPLMAGTSKWLTGVSAVHPLVGSVAAGAPWVALTVGVVGSVLVFLLFEGMAWRRDQAVEAQASEHRFAEALQRRLLPTVPVLEGLDVASSYVPGADHQQVGGDWFDVFELPSDQVAVVIGDVMGHDVEAAAIMAQLRASLRSFASEGGDPAWTVERLAGFIDLFGIPAVATVVYGLLDPPGSTGQRRFSWANAGHLPPLLRLPDGQVRQLDDGASPLLGAPSASPRPAGEVLLEPGATLLMYTDGLVEVHGESLGVTIGELCDVFAGEEWSTSEAVCAAVLGAQLPSSRCDDVALLVVQVKPVSPAPPDRDPESDAGMVRD